MTVTETLVAGRYRIGPCLGTGGMGRVWLARDELLRRDVAIKEIALPFGLTDEEREEMRARTLREARAAARLSHPNVVRTYDVQPGDERPWIVMEYVPSRSLLQVIKENGPLPAKDVAGIGLAVLSALDAAYRAGVHHRDIKPSNVLIADDGRVLLTDFGAAVVDEGEGALTQTGIILGSPRYIAPERAATGVSTLESDLWSLGATLYEAVEGRAPYTRETTIAMLVALATEKPDPVDRAGPLKPVINGLLQKKPENRMKPAEVEERLRRIADVQNAVRLHQVPPQRANGRQVLTAAPVSPPRVHNGNGNGAPVRGEASLRLNALAIPAAPEQTGGTSKAAPLSPPPVSAPPRAGWSVSRDRRRWALAGGAIAAAIVVLAAAFLLNGTFRSNTTNAEAATGTPTFVPSAPVVQPPSASPAAVSTALPAGYKWYNSKSGFHVAWPNAWTIIQENRTSVTLCNPGGPPVVYVREWNRSDPDLGLALRREETAAALPKYQRLRMVVAPTQDSAEWEYTFTDPKMGALHGLDRVVVANGRSYIVQWRTPARKWTDYMGKMTIVVDHFRPATTHAKPVAVPYGFVPYKSASGFQFSRPLKWVKIEESATSVVFCSPGKPPVVGVHKWTPSNPDLSAAIVRQAQTAKLPKYKQIAVDSVPGQQAAALEYTFTDPKMGPLHGLDRAVVTPRGTFLVQWRTPINEWTQNLAKLGVVTSSLSAATK
jgi:eukaryotic-like serine/threonine-protein kinase